MRKPLSYYLILARRWTWLIVLGIVISAGTSYAVSKLIPPVYQSTVLLIINLKPSISAFDNVSASQLATATYSQLLISPELLKPVVAKHPELTTEELTAMVSAKTQPNTSIIEVNVTNSNPRLAAQLANEISQSFANYANTQLRYASTQPIGTVQIVPADVPIHPLRPQSLLYTGIGALAGLGLAFALIIVFEWIDDRITWPDEVQSLLNMEILTLFPKLSHRQRVKKTEEISVLAEEYRRLCARLTAAQMIKPFKLMMVTSALVGEGKSSVAVNLASFLAMAGKRVLLVDANLRHPTLAQYFQLKNNEQLPSTLLEIWELLETRQGGLETTIPTLHILPIGAGSSSRPAELLQSQRVHQLFNLFNKAPFDYIIFDTSALLPVADAQILASYTEACLLVIDGSKTPRKTLLRAKQILSSTHVRILGAVVNKSYWPDNHAHRQYASSAEQIKTPTVISNAIPLKRNNIAPLTAASAEEGAPATLRIMLSKEAKGATHANNTGNLPGSNRQKAKG
jgi:polysaccharide biosynthesis transport protein